MKTNKRNYRDVVFDLGGVLIDWNPEYVYKTIFETSEEMDKFFREICTPEWNELQDEGRSLEEATEEKVAEFPEYEDEIRAFYGRWTEMIGGALIGTVEILETLIQDSAYNVYAMTNWSAETFPYALENFEFLHWFDDILVSGREKLKKPDPKFFDLLVERFQLDPSSTVFIDDNTRNIRAAVEYGFTALQFDGAHKLEDELINLKVLEDPYVLPAV